jgi:hypothetical protein
MQRSILALISATLMVGACGGPKIRSMLQSEFQEAAVDEPDGRVSLYSGHLIADALARGEDLESLAFMTAFLRVRVPRSLLEMVPSDPGQPVIISLEEAYPGVEILLHQEDYSSVRHGRVTQMMNTTFIPAEPWLTGHAQVLRDPSGELMGGAHIVKYSGTLPPNSTDMSWGMAGCSAEPGCPTLRYDNPDPCRWPLPLPSNWIVVSLMQGQPATLEEFCANR